MYTIFITLFHILYALNYDKHCQINNLIILHIVYTHLLHG